MNFPKLFLLMPYTDFRNVFYFFQATKMLFLKVNQDMIHSCESFFKTILLEQVSHKKSLNESQRIFYIL